MKSCSMLLVATMTLAACSSRKEVESAGGEVSSSLTDVDVRDYDLDMDKMRKWVTGMKALTAAARQDTSLAVALASDGNETTTQSIAKLEGNAKATEILRQAGLTPREYVMTMTAYLQAAMVEAASRATPPGQAPTNVNQKNVEFLKTHETELAQLMKEVGTTG